MSLEWAARPICITSLPPIFFNQLWLFLAFVCIFELQNVPQKKGQSLS